MNENLVAKKWQIIWRTSLVWSLDYTSVLIQDFCLYLIFNVKAVNVVITINTYLFCGSILLIYFILTTIMMLLSLLPLFLVCLGWDLQCFSQLSSSVFRTNPKRPQRGLGQQVFCHLRSVSLTDQNGSLVGFLLLTGMLAAVSCHGGPIDCHMFILTYLPFRTWVQY